MNSNIEISETRLFGSITTQSIRNLLPKSISNHQTKMSSILSKSKFSKENTPPSNPNLQIDNPPTPSSDLKKSTTKTKNSQKGATKIERELSDVNIGAEQRVDLSEVHSDPSVQVVVRIRPTNWREKGEDWDVRKASSTSLSVGDRTFNFDAVVDSSSTQEDIFKLIGIPLVKNSLAGFNTSILTYGQTGSGKTYTMWGPPSAMVEGHLPSSNQGIVPRIFQMLFLQFQKEQENSEEKQMNYQCRCSFLEVYNERIGDLLDPSRRNLQIGDNSKNGFYVENLSEEYVTSYEDVTHVLIKGLSNRKVGATSINSKSSRSHIIFTCVIESWCKETSAKGLRCSRTSRISFVDLAGSERHKLDDAGRQSIQEGRNVKKSLAQLGHLVHTLAEKGCESELSQSVQYKSSCLTHLLQESLGGNAKLTVICAVSPHDKCKGETLSTVRFGLQARSIQNKPVINEITEDDVNGLSDQIRQLKEELIKEKSNGHISVSSSGYFKGRNARESLNQLRISLNRSIVLPHLGYDTEEEMDINEEHVKNLCVQLVDKVESSCEEHLADTCSEAESRSSFESCSMVTCLEESNFEDNNSSEEEIHFKDLVRTVAGPGSSSAMDLASRSSLSITASRQPLVFQEPPLSESPKIENALRKTTATLSNLSANPNHVSESFNSNAEVLGHSVKRSEHIRASLRSSMMFSSPTESLAASLHRGLQIIDSHQRNSGSNKSSIALSFDHLALKTSQAMDKGNASAQTLTEEKTRPDGLQTYFICASCKREAVEGSEQVQDSLNMWVVPVDKAGNSERLPDQVPNHGGKALEEAAKVKDLEKLCAEQAAKIEHLNELVKQYKDEGQHSTDKEQSQEEIRLLGSAAFIDDTNSSKLENELKMIEEMMDSEHKSVSSELSESQSTQMRRNYIEEGIEEERRRWTEKESEWICLTDELRIDLESYRRHAEKMEMELRLEKKVTEELDDAVDRAVNGHARFVEHYADLQDKYNELLGRHKKIMEGIIEVQKAAIKAGKKGKNARFVKSLATELSALRVEREKEREHLKKENKSLRIQLRDTAEAVHAAGELLVRLREAEEAISIAEGNFMKAQEETEKVKKQLEKQKRKHAMEMVTMRQYLAESRLPESALRPVHWDEEDKANTTTRASVQDDDQAWRAEFGAIYQEHY